MWEKQMLHQMKRFLSGKFRLGYFMERFSLPFMLSIALLLRVVNWSVFAQEVCSSLLRFLQTFFFNQSTTVDRFLVEGYLTKNF